MRWLSKDRYPDLGLLIARVGFGAGFLYFHGLPKLVGGADRWGRTGDAISNFGITFGYEYWGLAAGLAEGVGGLLIALGLLFRPACLAIMFTMIVATTNHLATGEGTPAHAFKNAWLFAGLFFIGPGRYSIDAWLASRAARRRPPEGSRSKESGARQKVEGRRNE